MTVKVLGMGCATCKAQYEAAKEAVKSLGLDTEVEYITDPREFAKYGIMSTPAIVINGKVASSGRLLKAAETAKLLQKAGEPWSSSDY